MGVGPAWLARLTDGDRIDVKDARGSSRRWSVVVLVDGGALVEVDRTKAWLRRKSGGVVTLLFDLLQAVGRLHLQSGQTLRLKRDGAAEPASIACKAPEELDQFRRGERV